MLRIRRFEEACAELCESRRFGGALDPSVGGEACAVGAAQALRTDEAVVAGHRVRAHALLRGMSMGRAVTELVGVVEGRSRGPGGAMRSFDPGLRLCGGTVGGAGPQIAIGIALAGRMRHERRLTACVVDGPAAGGVLNESLALASRWRLPVLFLRESDGDDAGIDGETADGTDVEAVAAGAIATAERVRSTGEPAVLELLTPRAGRRRDPLRVYAQRLRDAGLLDDEGMEEIERAVTDEVARAIAVAGPRP
jgi:TPP-dependent pyruvate/acetoin dehydrogenase alpha subunit